MPTPFRLYEFIMMLMGGHNAPATHQCCMCATLHAHIGKICHIYLDDIIIWSRSLSEHKQNVTTVLEALWATNLYCSPKKTELFCTSLKFLGHHISSMGIEADAGKVTRILDWPIPSMASDVDVPGTGMGPDFRVFVILLFPLFLLICHDSHAFPPF